MAQFTIIASKSVSGEFEAFNSDGEVFRNKTGRTSYSIKGLRLALTKAGHIHKGGPVSDSAKTKQAVKTEKSSKNFEDSQAHKLGYSPELCDQVYTWVVEQRQNGFEGNFKDLANHSGGHTSEGLYAAFRVGKARHLAAKEAARTPEEKAERAAAKVAYETPVEGVVSRKDAMNIRESWTGKQRMAANEAARVYGFTGARNAIRAIGSDDRALQCWVAMLAAANFGTAAKAPVTMPAPATTENELLRQLAELRALNAGQAKAS